MDEAAGREQSFISVSLSCSLAPVFVFVFFVLHFLLSHIIIIMWQQEVKINRSVEGT